MADFSKFKTPTRIIVLRLAVFSMLAIAAAVLGALSFVFFRSFESSAFEQQFNSAAALMSASIQTGLNSKLYSAQEFSKMYSYQFGTDASWPNVTLAGFEQISSSQLLVAEARAISFNPLIHQSSRRLWEAYAAANVGLLYAPASLSKSIGGSWPVSNGIYMKTSSGSRIYNSYNDSGSLYPEIHVPVWQIAPILNNTKAVMYNLHSEPKRQLALDLAIKSKRAALTDVLQLVQDSYTRPSAILFAPVFDLLPSQNIVGFISIVFSWDAVIAKTLPSYLQGIDCILRTSTTTFTFTVNGGKVVLKGPGDMHDAAFDSFRKSASATLQGSSQLTTSDSVTYTFDLYPSQSMQQIFYTSRPKNVVVGVVLIIFCVTVVFLIYDYLVSAR